MVMFRLFAKSTSTGEDFLQANGKMPSLPTVLYAVSIILLFCLFSSDRASAETITDTGNKQGASFLVYIPDGCKKNQKYPWILGFSPNGRGTRVLNFVKEACDRYHWILVAPNNDGRPKPFLSLDATMLDTINTAVEKYPVDPNNMVCLGYAGGAVEAHHISVLCPDKVKGVIANCGIIHGAALQSTNYPKGKLAVLIASPTDYRFMQMRDNAQFLDGRQWKINWLEFRGGHHWAPRRLFSEAVGWMDRQLPYARTSYAF